MAKRFGSPHRSLITRRKALIGALTAPAFIWPRNVAAQMFEGGNSKTWPNDINTGVPAGEVLTSVSAIRSTEPGQIIENCFVHGGIIVTSDNVIIRKCKIVQDANTWYVVLVERGNNVTIEDCEVYATVGFSRGANKGIAGGHLIQRCNIHDVEQGINFDQGSMVRDNYIHNLNNPANSGPHFDGIATFGNNSNATILHNTVHNQNNQTDCIIIQNLSGPVSEISIDSNRLLHGGYTIYCEDKSGAKNIKGISFTNNRLGKGFFGYVAKTGNTIATWTNNVDDVTGLPIRSP